MLSDLEEKMIKLAEQQEAIVDQLKQNAEEIEKVLAALGIGHIFQAEDGTVYKVHQPKGTFTYFKHIDYKRTNRAGEKSGDALSKTEARALGFVID